MPSSSSLAELRRTSISGHAEHLVNVEAATDISEDEDKESLIVPDLISLQMNRSMKNVASICF
jgi:hypothetical protein